MQTIGFIGASGLMGHGMAKNLKTKGNPLAITAFRKRERVADLLSAGAKELPDPAAMARECGVVFLCVTGSPQVEEVVAGPNGLLAGASKGLIIVDCSTSEPDSTTRMRELAAAKGVSFIDAPLARTPVEAEAGKLNVMVGASAEDFARIEPLLQCFAENIFHVGGPGAGHIIIFHVGGPGAGHIIKLLNNFIAQAQCNAVAEAFAVGQRAGVDLKKLVALVSAGLVNSGLFQIMSKTLDGTLDGMKFELNNARKDVRYYTHMAESLGVPTVMGEATHQSLVLACALGFGNKLVPSLVEAQEKLANVKIVPR
jgi:3-hydroxyisobutyrate dehydrogenase-like beta-hydroxyacid dehydrogenase